PTLGAQRPRSTPQCAGPGRRAPPAEPPPPSPIDSPRGTFPRRCAAPAPPARRPTAGTAGPDDLCCPAMTTRQTRLALLDRYVRIPTVSRRVTPEMVEEIRAFWREQGLALDAPSPPARQGTPPP